MMTEHFSEEWDVEIIPYDMAREHASPLVTARTMQRCGPKTPERRITTTLYTLMAALQEQVGPDNDALVVALVWALIRSRRLTFCRTTDTPESTG
jgi:hypothetical protein